MRFFVRNPLLFIVFSAIASVSMAAQADESLAFKLAVIDEGRQVAPDSLPVRRAENALAEAAKVCGGEDEKTIGNQATMVSNSLRDKGVYSRPVDVLEGLKAIIFEGGNEETCVKVLSMYAAVRLTMTHSSAVAGIRVLYKTANTSQ